MKHLLGLQVTLFGEFDNIEAKPEVMAELIQVYENKFFPSVVQLNVIDANNNKFEQSDRISITSVDKTITLVFLPDRIDCNWVVNEQEVSPLLVEENLSQLDMYLRKALAHFSLSGNRLALNGRFVTDQISLDAEQYIHLNDFSLGKQLTAWTANNNALTSCAFAAKEEQVNNLLSLQLAMNADKQQAVLVSFDISTMSDEIDCRFTEKDFEVFVEDAKKNLSSMIANYR